MSGFKDLFPKSPFVLMVEHIDKVSLCLNHLEELFAVIKRKEFEKIDGIVEKIVQYENEADKVKDTIRKEVNKNLMIPVDKGELLSILTAQDGIADVSEDIGRLFSLRNMVIPEGLENDFILFEEAIMRSARKGVETVKTLGNIFEVGFRGPEVDKVIKIMRELEDSENMADERGLLLTKKILALEATESPVAIYMWMRIIKVMGDLANISEKFSNRFRLLLN